MGRQRWLSHGFVSGSWWLLRHRLRSICSIWLSFASSTPPSAPSEREDEQRLPLFNPAATTTPSSSSRDFFLSLLVPGEATIPRDRSTLNGHYGVAGQACTSSLRKMKRRQGGGSSVGAVQRRQRIKVMRMRGKTTIVGHAPSAMVSRVLILAISLSGAGTSQQNGQLHWMQISFLLSLFSFPHLPILSPSSFCL